MELRVIKEEQGKKKKIAAAQYWHCAPPQTQARHEKVPDEVTQTMPTHQRWAAQIKVPHDKGAQFRFPFRKSGGPRKAFLRKRFAKALNQKPRQFHGEKPISEN